MIGHIVYVPASSRLLYILSNMGLRPCIEMSVGHGASERKTNYTAVYSAAWESGNEIVLPVDRSVGAAKIGK